MLIFTFVYEENPGDSWNNKIEIDENLFKRIARDDMTALDELYGITERTMYAFSLSLTKDHQQALDLMQDTYVKILSAAHLYKAMGKPWRGCLPLPETFITLILGRKKEIYLWSRRKSQIANTSPM